jgi:ribonuclease D
MTTAWLIEEPRELADRVIARASRADRIAVDVESNGLFVYRPSLCVLQLAWREGDATLVAIVDPLTVPLSPLAPVLGAEGPVKVLHDLTLDAQLLAGAGAPLARVRDTSVAARLLGKTSTGLAALLEGELGVAHDKRLQQHDWARRPLGEDELSYLAGDVIHLLDLDERLAAQAAAIDVAEEIEEEQAYKLATALAPRREPTPAWMRVKGAESLDDRALVALRELHRAREDAAAARDVPPFKIATNELLLAMARRRPRSFEALAQIRGATAGLAGEHAQAWLDAIATEGEVSAEDRRRIAPPPPPRQEIARRRALRARIMGFRRAEAARRGVPEQAVLPGHCADDVIDAIVACDASPDALCDAILAVPGLGARRAARYVDMLVEMAAR